MPGPSSAMGEPFPSAILGFPVLTVAQAEALAAEPETAGRAMAVGGYYMESTMFCPTFTEFVGPFNESCRIVGFGDTEEAAQACDTNGCDTRNARGFVPQFMAESLSAPVGNVEIEPIILIAHVGDPRQWQCPPEYVEHCAGKLVVDRLVWADGRVVEPSLRPVYDDRGSLVPSRRLIDIETSLPDGELLLSAVVVHARDVFSIDPRFGLTGDQLVWLVRSTMLQSEPIDATHAETVSVIDDSSGAVVASLPLASAADYLPARVWTSAKRTGMTENVSPPDTLYPAYSIAGPSNEAIGEAFVSTTTFGSNTTLSYGPFQPALVEAGTYSFTAWLQDVNSDFGRRPADAGCTRDYTFAPSDDVEAEVIFEKSGKCAWQDLTPPDFGGLP